MAGKKEYRVLIPITYYPAGKKPTEEEPDPGGDRMVTAAVGAVVSDLDPDDAAGLLSRTAGPSIEEIVAPKVRKEGE